MSASAADNSAASKARQRAVEDAVHSGEMEGLSVGGEFTEDAAEYARGAISLTELGRRVRARNGVA